MHAPWLHCPHLALPAACRPLSPAPHRTRITGQKLARPQWSAFSRGKGLGMAGRLWSERQLQVQSSRARRHAALNPPATSYMLHRSTHPPAPQLHLEHLRHPPGLAGTHVHVLEACHLPGVARDQALPGCARWGGLGGPGGPAGPAGGVGAHSWQAGRRQPALPHACLMPGWPPTPAAEMAYILLLRRLIQKVSTPHHTITSSFCSSRLLVCLAACAPARLLATPTRLHACLPGLHRRLACSADG